MPSAYLNGSTNFGPVNSAPRSYEFTGPAFPSGDWHIGVVFRFTNNSGNSIQYLYNSLGAIPSLGNGNDFGLIVPNTDYNGTGANSRLLGFQMSASGQHIISSSSITYGTTTLQVGTIYVAVAQRNGSNFELWLCPLNGTANEEITHALNGSFGTKASQTIQLGQYFRGYMQMFWVGAGALTQAQIQNVAAGTDIFSIVTGSSQLSYLSMYSAGISPVINEWPVSSPNGNNASQNGSWSGQAPAAPLIPLQSGDILTVTTNPIKALTAYAPNAGAGASATRTMTFGGTYANYTPTAIRYAVLNASQGYVKNWTNLGSPTLGGGNWTGVATIPAGGPYFIQFQDSGSLAWWDDGDPFSIAPVFVTFGQSPMWFLETVYTADVALSGSAVFYGLQGVNTIEPGLVIQGQYGAGYNTAANQYSTVTSNYPVAAINTAVVGTSSADWAGILNLTMSGSTAYTVGETVQFKSGATVEGTAIVTSSTGTALVLQWSNYSPANGITVLGLTSGTSETVSVASTYGTACASCWPVCLTRVDTFGYGAGDTLHFYWLQGAADNSFTALQVASNLTILLERMQNDLTTAQGIAFFFHVIPHNRDTSNSGSATVVRPAQYNWALANAPQTALAFSADDMETITDQIAGLCPQNGSSTVLYLQHDTALEAAYSANALIGYDVILTGGTGTGQVGVISANTAGNAGTPTVTISGSTWSPTPDTTTTYSIPTAIVAPHPNVIGSTRLGARMGQDWASVGGFTNESGQGPIIQSVNYTGTGQTLTVNFAQRSGTALQTPAGGTSDANVLGFDVSENSFSTLKTLTSIAIAGPNQVTIMLSAPPTTPANLQVRYLYSYPFAPALPASVSISNASKTLTCTSTAALSVGQLISGNNIPADTVISSITNSTTLVMSNAATGSASGAYIVNGYLSLEHTLYDNTSISSGRGLPAWFTIAPINVNTGSPGLVIGIPGLVIGILIGIV